MMVWYRSSGKASTNLPLALSKAGCSEQLSPREGGGRQTLVEFENYQMKPNLKLLL